jgi:hypothetical protein
MTRIAAKQMKVEEITHKILFFQTELILICKQALINRLQQLNDKQKLQN